MLTHIFTTPIWRAASGLTPEQLAEIRDHLLTLREKDPGERRSNRGGWHSKGNLFGADQRQFGFLTDAVTKPLFAYIGEVFGYRGKLSLALSGWTIINRRGDYNAPHNHAANLLSGALYVQIPAGMSGGAINFLDPRMNLNAHQTEAMSRLGVHPPWKNSNVTVKPKAGDLLIFPSWLNHYVEPFECDDPDAVRIVISFNTTIR